MINDITLVSVSYKSGLQAEFFSQTARFFTDVIIVDNASADDSELRFAQAIPHARIHPLPRNIGFGAGNNVGIRASAKEWVLLLNPDCKIEEQDVIKLRKTLTENPFALAVGPKVVGPDGKPHGTYGWTSMGAATKNSEYPDTWGVASTIKLDGSCLMLRKTAFEAIGLFDEDLFMYFEEEDVGLRAIRAGFDVLTTPFATAVHLANQSSPVTRSTEFLKNYHLARSKLVMRRKYRSPTSATAYALTTLLGASLIAPLCLLLARRKQITKWSARGLASLDWMAGKRRTF